MTGSGEPSAGYYFSKMLVVSESREASACSPSKVATGTILMPLVWRGRVSNLRPPAPEDTLPLELSGPE